MASLVLVVILAVFKGSLAAQFQAHLAKYTQALLFELCSGPGLTLDATGPGSAIYIVAEQPRRAVSDKCVFMVRANNSDGVVISMQKMKLRRSTAVDGICLDYVEVFAVAANALFAAHLALSPATVSTTAPSCCDNGILFLLPPKINASPCPPTPLPGFLFLDAQWKAASPLPSPADIKVLQPASPLCGLGGCAPAQVTNPLVFIMQCPAPCRSPTQDDCKGGSFTCANSRCIWDGFSCDKTDNCGDGSDEKYFVSSMCIMPMTALVLIVSGIAVILASLIMICYCMARLRTQLQRALEEERAYRSRKVDSWSEGPYSEFVDTYGSMIPRQPLMSSVYQSGDQAGPYARRLSSMPRAVSYTQ
ncbi:uncharacterized protein [Dermacentor albipictus]|uniref:uncharacterized protein isoform X2 n=1 Tax=Dermacentor albipictus TaxID=60249 RepID=UPI0038FD1BA8